MSVKTSKTPVKARCMPAYGSNGSASWEEHGERLGAAVAFSTEFFASANKDRIVKASSVEVARNSYASGMVDMLTIARNALGFWGADQILLELERLNGKRAIGEDSKRMRSGPSASRSKRRFRDASPVPGEVSSSIDKVGRESAKAIFRDPMFA